MSVNKNMLFFLVGTICCGLAYGRPEDVSGEVTAAPNFGISEFLKTVTPVRSVVPREAPGALQTVLDEITPRHGSYQEWLVAIAKIVRDLLKQLAGFAPYIAKLGTPILKTVRLVLEKGRDYVVDYVRNLPPDTAQNIQMSVVELFKTLINMNLIRAVVRMFLRALI